MTVISLAHNLKLSKCQAPTLKVKLACGRSKFQDLYSKYVLLKNLNVLVTA